MTPQVKEWRESLIKYSNLRIHYRNIYRKDTPLSSVVNMLTEIEAAKEEYKRKKRGEAK